jgi:hypothetical protein
MLGTPKDLAILSRRNEVKSSDVTLKRLDEQINWYDEKSQLNQKWFKSLKLIVMITGGSYTHCGYSRSAAYSQRVIRNCGCCS